LEFEQLCYFPIGGNPLRMAKDDTTTGILLTLLEVPLWVLQISSAIDLGAKSEYQANRPIR
jgi:hypothetical protein